MFAAGLISTAGLIHLAIAESDGANWRAATVRDELATELKAQEELDRQDGTEDRHLGGFLVIGTESVYVIARTGYRPGRIVAIAASTTAAYLIISAACFGVAFQQRRSSQANQGSPRKSARERWLPTGSGVRGWAQNGSSPFYSIAAAAAAARLFRRSAARPTNEVVAQVARVRTATTSGQ